jgi:hypothetical protein
MEKSEGVIRMEIVIDINEHIYEQIMADSEVYVLDNEVDRILIENAIYNGTPLPEHHGRLIDEQQIIDRFKPIERFKHWCVGTDGLFNVLSDAPTIIEADKE